MNQVVFVSDMSGVIEELLEALPVHLSKTKDYLSLELKQQSIRDISEYWIVANLVELWGLVPKNDTMNRLDHSILCSIAQEKIRNLRELTYFTPIGDSEVEFIFNNNRDLYSTAVISDKVV